MVLQKSVYILLKNVFNLLKNVFRAFLEVQFVPLKCFSNVFQMWIMCVWNSLFVLQNVFEVSSGAT